MKNCFWKFRKLNYIHETELEQVHYPKFALNPEVLQIVKSGDVLREKIQDLKL